MILSAPRHVRLATAELVLAVVLALGVELPLWAVCVAIARRAPRWIAAPASGM